MILINERGECNLFKLVVVFCVLRALLKKLLLVIVLIKLFFLLFCRKIEQKVVFVLVKITVETWKINFIWRGTLLDNSNI